MYSYYQYKCRCGSGEETELIIVSYPDYRWNIFSSQFPGYERIFRCPKCIREDELLCERHNRPHIGIFGPDWSSHDTFTKPEESLHRFSHTCPDCSVERVLKMTQDERDGDIWSIPDAWMRAIRPVNGSWCALQNKLPEDMLPLYRIDLLANLLGVSMSKAICAMWPIYGRSCASADDMEAFLGRCEK